MKLLARGIMIVLALTLVLSGCGSGAEPAAEPSPPQKEEKVEKTESANKESGEKSDTPKSAAGENPDEEWNKIVEAAKKEGKIVMASAPSELYRDALVTPFEKKYPEIKIEYSGMNGRDFWPRVIQEHKVGQFLWDINVIGISAIGFDEAKEYLEPVRPLLNPELMDDSKWIGGLELLFMDEEDEYFPAFLGYAQSSVAVNREFISAEEFSSPEQLLDPKYKGKIVIQDPRSGAGLGSLAVMLAEYGEDFIRELLTKQDIVVTKDNRQLVEWVVRGRYPIGIGLDGTNLPIFQEKGIGLKVEELNKGPMKLSRGFSLTGMMKNAPHPNAARVYLNWLYSEEGQREATKLLKLNSLMVGIPPGDEAAIVNPAEIERYIPHQSEELFDTRELAQKLGEELVK